MKIVLFLFAITCLFYNAESQNTDTGLILDSLTLTTRNIQNENDLLPLSEDDPNYVEPKVEVTIQFTIANIENLKSIEILFEKEKGKKNFRVFTLDYNVADGKSYLTIKNRFYEIINSKVTITEQLPASILKRKIYFSVKGIDKRQESSNVLTREFN